MIKASTRPISVNVTDESIVELPIRFLQPYHKRPFKSATTQQRQALSYSILENGIQQPILVRPLPAVVDRYEIISGHERVTAARLALMRLVPGIIRNYSDNEADIVMVESNLVHRKDLSLLEKAYAYRIRLEAMSHQGKKAEGEVESERSRDKLSRLTGDSAQKIQRLIRLTYLNSSLQTLVDSRDLPFIAAVNELSIVYGTGKIRSGQRAS